MLQLRYSSGYGEGWSIYAEQLADELGAFADDPLARGRVFHSADAIDFEALRGKRVGVLGAGASAFDNAACALEAGATVDLFARRAFLPQVNKSKWTSFAGFFRGFASLDDAQRWRFYTYIFDEQVPPPWETVRRCDAFENFELRLQHGPQAINGGTGGRAPSRYLPDSMPKASGE